MNFWEENENLQIRITKFFYKIWKKKLIFDQQLVFLIIFVLVKKKQFVQNKVNHQKILIKNIPGK